MSIFLMTVTVFLTQLVFIWSRTWNVKMVAANRTKQVLISGGIVHLTWLLGITLGVASMNEVMMNFRWEYVPVLVGSLAGGTIGAYLGMKEKMKYRKP